MAFLGAIAWEQQKNKVPSGYQSDIGSNVVNYNTGKKKNSGGSSSNTGGNSVASTSNVNSSVNYYAQAQARAEEEAERRRKEREKAAKKAYQNNMSALSEAYAKRADALKSNYVSTAGTLENSYNQSMGNINNVSNEALREAYVNRMMAQKNMAQNMTAQGMSGGLSETAMAGLQNNYGNARNEIENTRATNLSDLENTYQGNLAQALQQYNAQLANDEAQRLQYQMQLENDLANTIASSYADKYASIPNLTEAYTKQMQALADAQAAYSAPESVNVDPYQTVSAESSLDTSDINKYIQYAKKLRSEGYNFEDVAWDLQNNYNLNIDALSYILNQLS